MTQTQVRTVTILRCDSCQRIGKQGMQWVTVKTVKGEQTQVLECECGSRNWKFEELDVVLCKPNYFVLNGTPQQISDAQAQLELKTGAIIHGLD